MKSQGRKMRDVYIIGVGMTKFGRLPEKTLAELGREAVWNAIRDGGVNPKEIQAGYCGNVQGISLWGVLGPGQVVLWEVGIKEIPIMNIENACASGGTAFREAWLGIAAGLYDMAIAFGVEKTFVRKGAMIDVGNAFFENRMGNNMPGEFALRAKRHMHEFGTTPEQLAKISVKNHHNGCLNPYSQFQKEFTVEEVINSAMVAEPLTVLSSCPNSDGAAAAILASKSVAKKHCKRPVRIAASVLRTGSHKNDRNLAVFDIELQAAKEAYDMSGYGPEDIDLCECHDPFTIAELMHYEGLGFCKIGEGGRLIDEGEVGIEGRVPFNPGGGLLSNGHPVGASGMRQIVEIVWQLRREAGRRQIENARVGLAQIMGGGVEMDVAAETIHILARD
jgi:benzoylsuccinyl-CoA thiolase BbsB subunit